MRIPPAPAPVSVVRWTAWLRLLRGLDALVGVLAVWVGLRLLLPGMPPDALGLLAALVAAGLAWPAPLRAAWRPVSGVATLAASSRLRPGDRAWYVRPGSADLVLITGRRGMRLTIASGAGDAAEGLGVRRTRVLLLPADRRA